MKLLFTAPLDFDPKVFAEYGETFELTTQDGRDAEILVCNPSANYIINDTILDDFKNLKICATPSTGENHLDRRACKRRGIKVLSLLDDRKGLDTISASAEFTFKLLLDALRKEPARELQGKDVGLVGFGRIGKRMKQYVEAFGAREIHYDPSLSTGYGASSMAIPFVWGDAVVICCTLNNETRGMVKKEHLFSMKPGAALINTARGEVIDELGLYEALAERPDIRFVTDVVHSEVEGRGEASRRRLRDLGAIVTPHIAGATYDSRTKAARIILNLLKKETGELCESGLLATA